MAAALVRGAFIVSAKRTPFGAFGGKLKGLTVVELAVLANRAAIEASGLPVNSIDSVVTGNVLQVSYIWRDRLLLASLL